MLTDRINSKFKSVQFRLFVAQVNGGLKDDCKVLVPNKAGSYGHAGGPAGGF